MDASVLPLAAFILTAIGWISREIWRWRKTKRLAAEDATKTLNQKKTLLKEMLSKTENVNNKNNLTTQLDEVNAALLGLYGERLRHTLKEAGLPTEETLIADGRSQLQPQQVARLKGVIAEVNALPPFMSYPDLLVLGSAYYHMQQYEDAIKVYDKILALNPNNPTTLNSRGIAYAMLEKYNEALADFNHALELSPNYPETLNNRGHIYYKLERYDEALVNFNRALELRPDYPDSLYNRGTTYGQLEKYNEALTDFNHALELRSDDPKILHNRGMAYAKLKRYDESIDDYNRSLELIPDDPSTLYNLACLFSLWGKTDDALAYLEKAISKDKKYREDAKTDKDFDNIRDDPRFKKLIEPD